jgi:putative flippase GtrA
MEKNYKEKYAKFIISGGFSTILDFAIYVLLSNFIAINPSKAISISCSTVFSFIVNKNWVFMTRNLNKWPSLFRYLIVFLINLSVNVSTNGLVFEFTDKKILAFIIATIAASLVNFSLQNKWVFK